MSSLTTIEGKTLIVLTDKFKTRDTAVEGRRNCQLMFAYGVVHDVDWLQCYIDQQYVKAFLEFC